MTNRFGRGRTPDPTQEGTVYRARPGWRRRRPSSDPGAPPSVYPAGQQPPEQPSGQYPSDQYSSSPRPTSVYPPLERPSATPPPARRRRRIRLRWVVVALVLILVGYPLALFFVAWNALGRIDAFPAAGRAAATAGTTYLVVGSDARNDLTRAEQNRLGTGQVAGQRTDTIMLLHVPAGGGPTVLVSVPRDSYVSIPGHGKNKINAAYAFGGPKLLVSTIEQATGLHVDSYVETGLGGYADLVDAVGGVTVCPKTAIKDAKAHLDVPKGCQEMDGKTALGYARARYSDPRGDLGRVERQREVLAAIAGKTLSPSVVLLPWRSFPAASAGGHALRADSGTDPLGLARFVLAMRAVAGGGGLSLTVPIGNPNLVIGGVDYVGWDTAQANALFAALRADNTEAVRPIADAQKPKKG